jgi:hypothetical protein
MEIKFDIQYIIEEKEKQINKFIYENYHIHIYLFVFLFLL